MKKYVATVPLRYGSKGYKPGDSFEAEERHGKLFVLIGKAKEAAVETAKAVAAVEPAPKRKYARKEQLDPPEFKPVYFRRDLTATD